MNYKLHARTAANNPYTGEGYITKDGRVMLQKDILADLTRKEYLEKQSRFDAKLIKRLRK